MPDPADRNRTPPPPPSTEPVKVLDSSDLFERGQTELRLKHQGEEYRLRITRQGKLILTK
jgi:hemin uptake protein HemP